MGAFSVTSSEMTKRTTELRSKNQSLKKQITKLRDSKEALNSTWDGSAKKAFSSAVESDVSQMTNFSNLIEQYCSALDNIIANYENYRSHKCKYSGSEKVLKGGKYRYVRYEFESHPGGTGG